MTVYTSYFGCMNKIRACNPSMKFVSIAGKSPTWFDGFVLSELAPKKWWWKIWHDSFEGRLDSEESIAWYSERYKSTVLSKVDPLAIHQKLESLKAPVCLLCYETPEKFCHRKLVKRWINSTLFSTCSLEWRDPKLLDMEAAAVLFESIGLKLVHAKHGEWIVLNPILDGHDIAPLLGNEEIIFDHLLDDKNLKSWTGGMGAVLHINPNPYAGLSLEEALMRAQLLKPKA